MITIDFKHLFKAVDARRARTKRVNDVENGMYEVIEELENKGFLRGEYSKELARKKKLRNKIEWCVLVLIAIVVLLGMLGIIK